MRWLNQLGKNESEDEPTFRTLRTLETFNRTATICTVPTTLGRRLWCSLRTGGGVPLARVGRGSLRGHRRRRRRKHIVFVLLHGVSENVKIIGIHECIDGLECTSVDGERWRLLVERGRSDSYRWNRI